MATIRDIAKIADLSPATISRALRNDPNISVATREKVAKLAAEMDYFTNAKKHNRASGKIIGVICPEIVSYNYASITEAVSSQLRSKGYGCVLMVTQMEAETEKAALETLKNQQVAGIILIMYDDVASKAALAEFKKKSKIPVVQIANFDEYDGYDSLMINNRQAIEHLIDYLLELGHKDIAIVADDNAFERMNITCDCLQDKGIFLKKNRKIIVKGERFEYSGYLGAMQLLKSSDCPTAVIAMYDYIAFGILRACSELGISVPEELSVVGIDNIRTASYIPKALTTVSMPHADMGRIAARLIVNRIEEGKKTAIQHVSLDPIIVVRETTAPIGGAIISQENDRNEE